MFLDDLRSRIFSILPDKWGYYRKSEAARKILGPVRQHVETMQRELDALDQVVDRYAPRDSVLRIEFPSAVHRNEFVAWFSDGGGEQAYFRLGDYDSERPVGNAIDYHSDGCVYAKWSGNEPGDKIVIKEVAE